MFLEGQSNDYLKRRKISLNVGCLKSKKGTVLADLIDQQWEYKQDQSEYSGLECSPLYHEQVTDETMNGPDGRIRTLEKL